MSLSEFEYKQIEKLVSSFIERRRPPAHIRTKVDLDSRIENQCVEIFEVRPLWNDPHRTIEEKVAKSTFVKKSRTWKIYWQRADLKWHLYEPCPEVNYLEEFLSKVDEDKHACFFG